MRKWTLVEMLHSLRSVVLGILFVDCLFVLTLVRQYLQQVNGPHATEDWFDPGTSLKVSSALVVWMLGWSYLWIEEFVSRNDHKADSSIAWWAIANILMAAFGIVSIFV